MRILEIEPGRADAVEAGLTDVRRLEGEFGLREWTAGRFQLVPASSDRPRFKALTGLDREHGRITLLRNGSHCIVMIDATARPYE